MKIIPVIDICKGRVVHAKSGQRKNYKPVHSRLCKSTAPLSIVQAFLGLYPFDTLYIADLDAISGDGDNQESILEITETFKSLQIWLDNNWMQTGNSPGLSTVPVIGSETGVTISDLDRLTRQTGTFILSLDHKDGRFLGDQGLLHENKYWPGDIIVLNLSLVGTSSGPDFELVKTVKALAGDRRIYYGGGIRNIKDMECLADLGLTGVLVATLLHDGMLDSQQIETMDSAME